MAQIGHMGYNGGVEAPSSDIKEQIRSEAIRCGFDVCGFGGVAEIPHAAAFAEWLDAGCHAGMTWLEREPAKRMDPRAQLDGGRTAILLGTNYYQPRGPERGVVARYALGKDYHDLVMRRLRTFGDWMNCFGGRQRPFVDTSPIMEKPLAERAGIGWQGKNSMLINREFGNWLILGGLLTTLELPADASHRNHCGTCTRCMDICPTRAITEPYRVDARRCISYLTIEHKGSIPEELRPLIGEHLFGCDDCLDVCPWNRWAKRTHEPFFDRVERPDLRAMLEWDDATFRAHYRGTPIFRLKRGGWLRNICVVLGNCGGKDDLAALGGAMEDEDPLVREHAGWATRRIGERLANSTDSTSGD